MAIATAGVSIECLYLKDIYKDVLQKTDKELPQNLKDKYPKFLRQFFKFYRSDIHNGFLHDRKVNWKNSIFS